MEIEQFPAGTIANDALLPDDRLSWIVEVLPFIEQRDLHSRIDRQVGWNSGVHTSAVQTQVKVFVCPDWSRESSSAPVHYTTYLGIAGLGANAPWLRSGQRNAGIFGYDRRTALREIVDGTSNTLLILESARDNGPWARGGWTTVRGLVPCEGTYLGTGKQFGGTHFAENSVFKRGRSIGCNAALADGSVRFVREEVQPSILEGLATIAGGEKIGHDW